MRVVKVGGSLYDWPGLPTALRAWLACMNTECGVIVPGGGATADAVRSFDRTFQLGADVSHWLAIRSLSVNARLLLALLPDAILTEEGNGFESWRGWRILDPMPFFRADEANEDHLPHLWDVTSDSLALRVAILLRAKELTLLKSTDASFGSWHEARETGIVDRYFATAMQAAPPGLAVRIVNLRRWHAENVSESDRPAL